MRVTKPAIDNKIKVALDALTDESIKVSNDITLTKDFTYDIYALFAADRMEKRRTFKNYWDLFMDVRTLYVSFQIYGLRKTLSFYNHIKDFMQSLITTQLFRRLDELDPFEATRLFLEMFKPKDQPPLPQVANPNMQGEEEESEQGNEGQQAQGGNGNGQGQAEDNDQNQQNGNEQQDKKDGDEQENENEDQGQSKTDDSQDEKEKNDNDQSGTSADPKNLPIDLDTLKNSMPKIEKIIKSGVFDHEDIKKAIAHTAGIEAKDIKLTNINKLIDEMGDSLDEDLIIFNVARKHEFIDVYRKSESIDDSPTPDNDMTISQNKSINDIVRALPMEYLYDDDLFTKKVMEHSLNIIQPQSRTLKRQVLYMLLDVSGSMEGDRGIYASGVAVSLLRQALREKATYFLRYFDYQPSELRVIKTKEEAQKMIEELLKQPYSGGGTNFNGALNTAIYDIKNDPVQFEEAEIMMITDGDCATNVTRDTLDFIKLHTVVIAPDGVSTNQIKYLKDISESHTILTGEEIRTFINGDDNTEEYETELPF